MPKKTSCSDKSKTATLVVAAESNAPLSDKFDHKTFVSHLTQRPGIYQMVDNKNEVIYVGKAKNLKKRVSSYFRSRGLDNKTVALVARIHNIEVTITNSETEALLLEHNLIKNHRPQYNILLRDDKSYPYIFLSDKDKYPRLSFHRGAKRKKGRYFGPYPSSSAVRDSLYFLQKVFMVRQCEDSYFNNRSRPCLQYQIKRCHGPCVDVADEQAYRQAVHHTTLFLEGKSKRLVEELGNEMEAASQALEFERAAEARDQIAFLQKVREKQYVEGESGDVDIVCVALKAGSACVQVLFVRDGRILGSRSYFPKTGLAKSVNDMLDAFLPQFYLAENGKDIPREIVVGEKMQEPEVLMQALSEFAGHKISLSHKVRGNRAQWVKLANQTAEQNLTSHLINKKNIYERIEMLQEALGLEAIPQRMECFDISHSSGELTVASCVVFDSNGPLKSDYRRFNIDGITGGDDYAAMKQALTRRYKRIKSGEGALPDILFIDGGRGQLNQAREVMEDLQISGIQLVGVAKGEGRKPGLETLFLLAEQGFSTIDLAADSSALHLIQHIRDEAHRFAITGHKQRRDKKRRTSTLEEIPGIGAKRRKELLKYFGGLQGIQSASAEELAKVPSISQKIANGIYLYLHDD